MKVTTVVLCALAAGRMVIAPPAASDDPTDTEATVPLTQLGPRRAHLVEAVSPTARERLR